MEPQMKRALNSPFGFYIHNFKKVQKSSFILLSQLCEEKDEHTLTWVEEYYQHSF